MWRHSGGRNLRLRGLAGPGEFVAGSAADAELTLAYRPAIGGAALELDGRAQPPAPPAEVGLTRVRGPHGGKAATTMYAGRELAAEGVFARRWSSAPAHCRRRRPRRCASRASASPTAAGRGGEGAGPAAAGARGAAAALPPWPVACVRG